MDTTNNTHVNTSSAFAESQISNQDNVTENPSTTNFVNSDQTVTTTDVQMLKDIGTLFTPSLKTYMQQNIVEFLKKPMALYEGSFTVADAGIMRTLDAYDDFLNNPAVYNKIEGHLAIRGTIVLTLVHNANRFQQGRYFLSFLNYGGASVTVNGQAWQRLHMATLCQRTQLPKVDIDLATATASTFRVPWMSAYSHGIVGGPGDFTSPGLFYLNAYSPLVAPTGSTIAPYTIYVHMEDVTLEAPTVPQSKVRFVKSPQANEQQVNNIGPIESTITKVSRAVDIVGQIPLLSSIAGPTTWFLDIAASVANVFGWSNPLDLSEVTRAVQTIVPYANNCDAADGSMPLALFARNEIEVLPGLAATDIDEASIDHIKSIPAYFTAFNWTTSRLTGDILATIPMRVIDFQNTITDNGRFVTGHAPVAYLANFFAYVRGGYILRFKMVKTEFHSGRIMVCFSPTDPTKDVLPSYANSQYTHREIIDIREGAEFTFHVPYTSVRPYLRVSESYGYVRIFVVNPLVAPASVSTTIRFLVEVAGAPDFEYAGVSSLNCRLNSPSAPQSKVKFVPSVDAVTESDIGNSVSPHTEHASRHCMGEKIMSIYSLLKHNNPIVPNTQGTTAASAVIAPFAIQLAGHIGAVAFDSLYRPDLYSMLVACYAYSRGSVRWRIFNNTTTTTNSQEFTTATVRFATSTSLTNGLVESTTPVAPTQWALRVQQNSIFRGCVEVQTPPYHHTYARCNVDEIAGNSVILKNYGIASANNIVLDVNTATATGNRYQRQVADDFQVAGFISCPSVWYN